MSELDATEEDYAFIRRLRQEGVLEDLDGERMPSEKGTIVIPCADGDRFGDLLRTHWGKCGGRDCHHILALNGGPLLIPRSSPLNKGEGDILLAHAFAGHLIKNVTTVVLYCHWPCGAAITANISLKEAIILALRAKDRARRVLTERGLEGLNVVLCWQVDYNNNRRVTYHFNRDAWNDFAE